MNTYTEEQLTNMYCPATFSTGCDKCLGKELCPKFEYVETLFYDPDGDELIGYGSAAHLTEDQVTRKDTYRCGL